MTKKIEGVTILRGPDGVVYMLSDSNLEKHRVPSELVDGLLKAYQSQQPAAGSAGAKPNSTFTVLASGKLTRYSSQLEPIDTWVDTM